MWEPVSSQNIQEREAANNNNATSKSKSDGWNEVKMTRGVLEGIMANGMPLGDDTHHHSSTGTTPL
jgi:hypothetical protein